MDNRILALDLSLSSPGFAVISITDGKPFLLEASHVKTNPKHTHGQRLLTIQTEIIRLVDTYSPFIGIVREKGFSRHAQTTQALFKVVGVADVTFANDSRPMTEIPPTTVKKLVTGDGKADKSEVDRYVRQWLSLRPTYEIKTDDESDAMAVGLAYALQNNLIEKDVITT